MARKRLSVQKRERENLKRERERKKAAKSAAKRDKRLQRGDTPESPAPPEDGKVQGDASG